MLEAALAIVVIGNDRKQPLMADMRVQVTFKESARKNAIRVQAGWCARPVLCGGVGQRPSYTTDTQTRGIQAPSMQW